MDWRVISDETVEAIFNPRVASADAEGNLVRESGLDCAFFELPDSDHFTVLERSFEAESDGWRAILGLLGGR